MNILSSILTLKQRLSPMGGAEAFAKGQKARILLLLLFALTLTGCDKDDPAIIDPNLGDNPTNPLGPGIDPDDPTKGPDWTYTPNENDYQTMTITLRLPDNLAADADAADRLTALAADNTVCGTAQADPDDLALYYLTVGAPRCESNAIAIAYYSARNHTIWVTAPTYTFLPDENIGTYLTPLVPSFRYSGK